MQKSLLAGMLLSLCGSAIAQSVPAFQSGAEGNANQSASEMFFIVEQLRDEVRNLRGTIEEQQYRIDQLSDQTRDRYVDLDGRLLDVSERVSALEAGQGAAAGSSGAPGNSASRAGSGSESGIEAIEFRQPDNYELKTYQAIQEKIRARDYSSAINDLYQFISDFPEGDLTVNAYYWLGEVYLAESEFNQARQAFTIVTARFPTHRKAPDALYKLGIAQDRLGEESIASSTMNSVIERYPQSNAANLATDFLE